jgi:hypothetical protein
MAGWLLHLVHAAVLFYDATPLAQHLEYYAAFQEPTMLAKPGV